MDRVEDPGAHEEGPQHRQRPGGEDERDVPDLQHPALLLHHHRVQEGRAGQPRQQRGVLDRVPGPVAAPAQLGVGPAGAEQDPDAEEEPGRQREAARRADPVGVHAPHDERPDGEGEGHRPQRVPRVEHRGVDHHARVAQERVEPGALRRGLRHGVKGRDREDEQRGEEGAEAEQHGRRVGRHVAQAPAHEEEHEARPQRQQPHPEQQRALLGRPRRGRAVEGRRRGRRVRGDDVEVEVRAQEGDLEDREGRGRQHRQAVDRAPPGVDPVAPPGERSVERGADAVAARREGEEQAGLAYRGHEIRSATPACR